MKQHYSDIHCPMCGECGCDCLYAEHRQVIREFLEDTAAGRLDARQRVTRLAAVQADGNRS